VSVIGSGGLWVTINDGGTGGVFSFGANGSIGFQNLSSALDIDGTAFALVDSVKSLASGIQSNPSGAYAFAGNYDASQDGIYTNSPIATTLSGTLEGLGNTISNLSVKPKGSGYFGLFAQVGGSGAIENVKLSDLDIIVRGSKHSGSNVGGLVGDNKGTLFDDRTAGTISTKMRAGAGGVAGINLGTISASSANVSISGGGGGLVGGNYGTISLSHAGGVVHYAGGGLVASNYGTISQSYETGKVVSGGGLVYSQYSPGTIRNSYATGAVGGGESGGFIADDTDEGTSVTASYSTGAVPHGSDGGGFVCDLDFSDFSDDYWDTTTSGTRYGECYEANVSGVTGLTNHQLRSGLPVGFDPTIWAEDKKINNGLPYLIANPPEH
jgi:hypothetical protein